MRIPSQRTRPDASRSHDQVRGKPSRWRTSLREPGATRRLLIGLVVLACIGFGLEQLREPAPKPLTVSASIARPEKPAPIVDIVQAVVAPPPRAPSLRGLVRAHTGRALAGAVVCLVDTTDESPDSNGCVNTDPTGRFAFATLPSDAHAVLASLPGYRPERKPLAGKLDVDLVIELELGEDGLGGHVVDATGGPVKAALVTLRGNAEATLAVTASASDGVFEIARSPGAIEVCAQAEAYSRTCRGLGGAAEDYVLVLAPESRIIGQVRNQADGKSIPHATVTASNHNGLQIPPRTTTTGDDGTFSIDALPAGGYELVAVTDQWRTPDEWVAVGLGETSTPVTLWANPAVRVSGRVLLDGAPCRSGTLELAGPISAQSATSADGNVILEGIIAGRYDATARCDTALERTVSLEVRDAPVEHEFSLEKFGDSPSPSPGKAPSGGSIRATLDSGPETVHAVFADALDGVPRQGRPRGGAFVIEPLPAGEYRVYVDDHVEEAEHVRVAREGEMVDVRLRAPAPAWIRGHVTSEGEVPVADAWVSATRSDLFSASFGPPPILTAADGSFNLPAVRGATYTLLVSSPLGDTEVHAVQAGQEVSVHVSAPASLSGVVQTAEGAPVPEFTLSYSAEHDTGGHEQHGTNSGFHLSLLEPDNYTFRVSSPLGSALAQVRLGPRQAATLTLTLAPEQPATTN
jgi:hypothetical protein